MLGGQAAHTVIYPVTMMSGPDGWKYPATLTFIRVHGKVTQMEVDVNGNDFLFDNTTRGFTPHQAR
jgi:hypothetical protein